VPSVDLAGPDGTFDNDAKSSITVHAPAVFGDEALWFADVSATFTARSVAYTEVMVLPIITVLSIANKDQIRNRYRVFRDAMRETDMESLTDRSNSRNTTGATVN
jgi:hypothetical protein